MKKLILAAIFGVASLSSLNTKAQISLSINIGSQPAWGPTGYDHVDYYYLPDVDAYYYVPTSQYIYLVNGQWAWRSSLPSQYSGYDPYNSYKVVVNRPKPYLSHQRDIQQYAKFKNYHGKQGSIRDSKDSRYNQARNNDGRHNSFNGGQNRPGNQPQQHGGQPQQHQQGRPQQHQGGQPQQHQQGGQPQQHQQGGQPQQHQGGQPQQHQQGGKPQQGGQPQQHQQGGQPQEHRGGNN
ncbi:hypothetical protein [Pedobacter sp. L105]|uniref:hypothetical protein n=1 Tax=Pedobacter sp. L105 TaxID=1641871 RepID=UPI00131D6D16|nr:hypothetical protein [Pedobacter sp. L105]